MHKFLALVSFFLLSQIGQAQIGGLSQSKFVAFSYGSLPAKTIEFEPNFNYGSYSNSWDSNGNLVKTDTTFLSSSLTWRVTYGITDKLEVGMFASDDFSFVNWATKYDLYEKNKHQFGIMAGLNTFLGNRQVTSNNPDLNSLNSYGIGLIYSWAMDDKQSLDANVQYGNFFSTDLLNTPTLYYSLDYGRYFTENYLLVLAASYQDADPSDQGAKFLFLSPGVSIEHKEQFQLAINANYPILGSNTPKALGYTLAVTICLK